MLYLGEYKAFWPKVDRTLFKLSNYRAYMEIGADPEFRGIDWTTAKGSEYLLFERVVESMSLLNEQIDAAAVGQESSLLVDWKSRGSLPCPMSPSSAILKSWAARLAFAEPAFQSIR